MKILLIIDSKNYKYHNDIFIDFENALVNFFEDKGDNSLEVIDVGIDEEEHVIFNYIKGLAPDFVITVDFAGFNMRTTGDSLSYNGIPCRMAHYLIRSREAYLSLLNYRQNFSMYTYIQESDDINEWKNKYPGITNIGYCGKINYKNISDTEHRENVELIEKWLQQVLEDLRL